MDGRLLLHDLSLADTMNSAFDLVLSLNKGRDHKIE